MVTKIRARMIKLHTHVSSKNTQKNEIIRGHYALKYIS